MYHIIDVDSHIKCILLYNNKYSLCMIPLAENTDAGRKRVEQFVF